MAPGQTRTETFTFVVTDGDGDSVEATFKVDITDTRATFINGGPVASAVDEENIPGAHGNPGDSYPDHRDIDGVSYSVSNKALNINWGNDDGPGRSVTFNQSQSGLNGLQSDGDAVKFTLINGGTTLIGYTGNNPPSNINAGSVVFYATLDKSGSGSYDFVLKQPLDHFPGDNSEKSMDLVLGITAKDSEGDSSSGSIKIQVNDDAPVADNVKFALDTVDDNAHGEKIGTIADLLKGVSFGADGKFDDGKSWTDNDYIKIKGQGSLGGTVSIDDHGNLIYTPDENVAPGQTKTETFTFVVTDGDGDSVEATFKVDITDTRATFIHGGPADGAVDEEGLGGNVDNPYPGDVPGALGDDRRRSQHQLGQRRRPGPQASPSTRRSRA